LRACLLALVFIAVLPASASANCANADTVPTADNLPAVRAALLCLHNEARAQRDVPKLREDARLRRAATAHSAEMIEDRLFRHGDFVERLLDSGYANGDEWAFGENLAWGAGELATPAAVMAAWLDSSGQRRTILQRDFTHLGIGIRLGLPTDPTVGVTITTDFGGRG
jgi:uncharacterized protein YkwD